MKIQRWLQASLFLFLLTNCSISNEGSTDYRYFDPSGSVNKYVKASLLSNYEIKNGDALQVSIKQAYIKNFTEIRSLLNFVRSEPANGEIAIVVNAFERGSGNLDFSPEGAQNGRVVFFSDDVWEGQFLNFSNLLTVYGPLDFKGNNLVIDIYIIEFDQPGEQLKSILKTLSDLGGTFYPPASPLSGALAQMSNDLITNNQDDRTLHFTYELTAINGGYDLATANLLAGNYVLIREEERDSVTDWNKLGFDENSGRVILKNAEIEVSGTKQKTTCAALTTELPKECFYTDNTYIVLEVNKAKTALSNETNQMIYKDLVSKLDSNLPAIYDSTESAALMTQITQSMTALRTKDDIKQQIDIIASTTNTVDSNQIAIDNFISKWFGDTSALSTDALQQLENNIAEVVVKCQQDQSDIIETMTLIRSRVVLDESNTTKVIKAIDCLNISNGNN